MQDFMEVIAVPFVEREQPTHPGRSLTKVSFIVSFLRNCNQVEKPGGGRMSERKELTSPALTAVEPESRLRDDTITLWPTGRTWPAPDSVSQVLLKCRRTRHRHCRLLSSYNGRAEWWRQRLHSLQTLKDVLSCPSQRRLAKPCTSLLWGYVR